MSSLSVFAFEGHDIRWVDGLPVANDVAAVLGYKYPSKAVSTKVSTKNKGVAKMVTPGGTQSVAVLEEAGIYQLIFGSKLESAQQFQDWVFSEVLPQIRKTGSYIQKPQTYLEALKALVAKEEERILLEETNRLLEVENQALSEAVDELFDYSSIIRVAKFNGVSEETFSWRKLKAASKVMELEIKKVPCPRFVYKLLYSHDAWRHCYPGYRLPETTTLVISS